VLKACCFIHKRHVATRACSDGKKVKTYMTKSTQAAISWTATRVRLGQRKSILDKEGNECGSAETGCSRGGRGEKGCR
jgi:hypothetical protein